LNKLEEIMFRGSMVAIITPFRNGKIDEKALRDLIEFQLAGGTDAIVPCGTTGESATLTHEEHKRVVEVAVEQVAGRVPVIAGTGSNSTEEAISLTRHAKSAGASGALLITPYYNKPTQEGLYQHYAAVARAVDLPLVLYNIPGRTSVNMLPQTVARLSKAHDGIVGIKEGTGSLLQISETIQLCGERFSVLSGDDFTALPTMAVGGKGVISVTANLLPREMAEMIHSAEAGDYAKARPLHDRLYPLHAAMFLETNPIPVKTALSLMGKCSDELRLPLCPMGRENAERLKQTLKEFKLI
jgi:4-hydroxy-tetrahydrodipicolinate synthase